MKQITTRGGPPGGHNPPGRARAPRRALVGCALLGPPPVPIFWYISHFDIEKIRGGLSGWRAAVSRRNLGRSTFALRWSDSARGNSLTEGKSSSSSLRESWIRGCPDGRTIPSAGLLDYEDTRLKTLSRVRMGLSLAMRYSRSPTIVTDSV